jgi:hypothetical protein
MGKGPLQDSTTAEMNGQFGAALLDGNFPEAVLAPVSGAADAVRHEGRRR